MTVAAPVGAAPARTPTDAGRGSAAVLIGVLWGVAVSLLESFVVSPSAGDPDVFWRFLLWIMPGWCAVGIALVVWTRLAGARLERPSFFAASVVGCAIALSTLWSGLYAVAIVVVPASGVDLLFPHGIDPAASFLYQAWVVAFYGGLYMFAWTLNGRVERTRHVLGRAGLARLQTETLLGEAQLGALRGHVDPQFLLRVMSEVERRYAEAPARADRLVGLLVAFLRLAMPGVRSGRATLAGELALARAYADLWADIDPARPSWRIAASNVLPDAAFPPLLLLAALDSLVAALPAGAVGVVRASRTNGEIVLGFDDLGQARAGWLAPDLAYRMRVGLSTLYGTGWTLNLGDETAGGRTPLEVRFACDSGYEATPNL